MPPRNGIRLHPSIPCGSGGNVTQVVFDCKLSPATIVEGVALAVGLIGGLFPAQRAARLPIDASRWAPFEDGVR